MKSKNEVNFVIGIILFIIIAYIALGITFSLIDKSHKNKCESLMKFNKAPINEALSDYPPELRTQLLLINAKYLNTLIYKENMASSDFEKEKIKIQEQEVSNSILEISSAEI